MDQITKETVTGFVKAMLLLFQREDGSYDMESFYKAVKEKDQSHSNKMRLPNGHE